MKDPVEKTKEEDWLLELCGSDTELYEISERLLYWDPLGAISKEELQVLIEEAEKSDKDGNYIAATRKYTLALDKAIFEATQHGEEKDRYIKVIQDISAKTSRATGKVKEEMEKTAPKENVISLEQSINHYKLLNERTEDVVKVASLYYNEKMDKLGEQLRRDQRAADSLSRERESKKKESEETKEEKKDKKRQKEKVEHKLEERGREKKEQETEDETRRARKEKILETRREEEKGKTGTS